MAVTNTKITAFDAEAEANHLLHGLLPDRFTAGDAWFDPTTSAWRVPVVLAYPFIGPVGEVGEVLVSESAERIISHTAPDEMKTRGRALYKQHREAIETAFSQTRDS